MAHVYRTQAASTTSIELKRESATLNPRWGENPGQPEPFLAAKIAKVTRETYPVGKDLLDIGLILIPFKIV